MVWRWRLNEHGSAAASAVERCQPNGGGARWRLVQRCHSIYQHPVSDLRRSFAHHDCIGMHGAVRVAV